MKGSDNMNYSIENGYEYKRISSFNQIGNNSFNAQHWRKLVCYHCLCS